jgi:hypothetical protein
MNEDNLAGDPIGSETGPDPLPFAARILTPKRLREWEVVDEKFWLEIDARYNSLPETILREIARADRREYDARRDERPRGKNSHKGINSKSGVAIENRPRTGGHFVAIDSEGLEISRQGQGPVILDQRTCLWMAGGAEGYENQSIVNTEKGLSSEEIFEFLLSLKRKFAAPSKKAGGSGKSPIFLGFGFSYDVAQIVKDFHFDKGWELQNGRLCRQSPRDCWT